MQRRHDSAEARWEHRVDRGALLPPVRRADGSLLVEGFAAREGVLEYRNPDGSTRRELVPLETLKTSIHGLGLAAVTLQHPDPQTYPLGVTPDNTSTLMVGTTDSDVELREGGFIRVRIAVKRRDAIDAIDAGTQELSPGYDVRIDPTPGVHPVHGRYDCVQVERRYNHLAIVDQARGGSEVRIRADAAYSTEIIGAPTTAAGQRDGGRNPNPAGARPRGGFVNTRLAQLVALLGITRRVDSDDQAIDAIEAAIRARKDAEEAAMTAAMTEEEKLKAQIAALMAELDGAKADMAKTAEELAAMKAATAETEMKADRAILEPIAKALKLDAAAHPTNAGLRKAIAQAHLGTAYRANADAAYDAAAADLAIAAHKSRGDGANTGATTANPWASNRTETESRDDAANRIASPALSPLDRVRQKNAESAKSAGGSR